MTCLLTVAGAVAAGAATAVIIGYWMSLWGKVI